MRRVKKIALYLLIAVLVFVVLCNVWIILKTDRYVYDSVEKIPHRKIALVLGTSRKLSDGSPNPFFTNRIEAAYSLFVNKKVDHIIVSGDNRSRYYNEPAEMRKALVAKGVSSTDITLDFAGLRTLDSIVRCQQIFGQDSVTIITQPFHCYRALFISQFYNMNAVAMEAEEPEVAGSAKVIAREIIARPLAVLDLYVFGTSPRFLGEKEELNSD
jgi:SanA protein